MDVKPWEPVSGGYFEEGQWPVLAVNPRKSFYGFYPHAETPVHLTLANGQKIVVRPLSDERKDQRKAYKLWMEIGRKALADLEVELKSKGLM